MKQPKHFVSCDWGTSNFRVRLIDFNSLEVIKEHKTEMGVKKLYQSFLSEGKADRQAYFSEYLLSQLQQIVDINQELTIVACGMITSTMGMIDMEYATMPISDKVDTLNIKHLDLNDHIDLILISGVKTTNDVMRGEEVQAIGLMKYLKNDCYLLLPGTHSKHLKFEGGSYNSFQTFMTGELFEIISQHSILKDFLMSSKMNDESEKAFLEGVRKGSKGELLGSLFGIRAQWVAQAQNIQEEGKSKGKDTEMYQSNFYFLSGLLLGNELSYLQNQNVEVVMAASGVLSGLYQIALKELKVEGFTSLSGEVLEKAMIHGQKMVLEQHLDQLQII
ncbi:2-dehydro-3-deoxygalactonokinase [Flammeovirga sp. MY04]|uniref:2-dehydro-3-deoxygalactonokinase n=1 Tax=Flammeovirga sp. MY04 TaxID=1191459 RepID=UPI00080610E7|nr:2-dehydro-3-deoxygalactonokinase [Flammeovirga sp. MY04]ANQ52362.1 2-dehydro-3-deoxygalactonokinase [Flammeovirga sp. MY04]